MALIELQIQEGVLIHDFYYIMKPKTALILTASIDIKEKWEETCYLLNLDTINLLNLVSKDKKL